MQLFSVTPMFLCFIVDVAREIIVNPWRAVVQLGLGYHHTHRHHHLFLTVPVFFRIVSIEETHPGSFQ